MGQPNLILGIGELLWDLLPEGPRLGGAPANFTVMAARLGNHAAILSRVGRDELGREAMAQLGPLPVDAGSVQIDAAHETGRVTVEFSSGQPSYTIHEPAAWDFLELTDDWIMLAERAGAICFGSLAQRSDISRQTIQSLVAETQETCTRVFDVNLRAPYYSAEIVQESLELASVIKMNDAEVPLVLGLLDLDEGLVEVDASARLRVAAQRLLSEFPELRLVAVTRGGHGSLLVSRQESREHPGFPIVVADTIGAGDAFTAAMTHYLLRGASLATVNEAGNRWGAWVASQSGAMPELRDDLRAGMAAAIEAVG
ncbi:MAG TPA: PfkB family carbohydrate kinase [Terracidiphilus sp.]|nr:PfkB family carbohydrate kinase [Terracidiphilus sp.]